MNYIEILKSVGWPTNILVIDFETYYDQDYSLSKMSTIEYVTDPRFEFTGCGYFNSDVVSPEALFCDKNYLPEFIKDMQDWHGENFEKVTVVIQNAKFDALILKEKFNIVPPYIIDIVDLAKHYDARMSHHLKDLAKMFGLKPKGDTSQFKGLHYKEMDKETKTALVEYTKTDIEDESELFKILLPLLSNPIVEIPLARHTLGLYLNPRIKFDRFLAKELKEKMLQEMNNAIHCTNLSKKIISGNISFAKALQDALPEGEHIPMKPGKPTKNITKLLGVSGLIPALAKNDEGTRLLLAHPKREVQALMIARQAIKSWPLHIKKIENMERQATCKDGLLGMPLGYYNAHTGRWGGGEKINPQNFGGRGRGTETHKLIQQMRGLLTAPDGWVFYIADYAQIEARLLAWLAGQDDLIEDFVSGRSPYCSFATDLFKEEVHKPTEQEKKTPEGKKMAVKYGFGKDAILGCGYGMGTNRFYSDCLTNPDLRPMFDSGEYDWDFIHKLIKTYRSKYARIPEFWRSVEKAFKWVIKYPHEVRKYCINDLAEHTLTFWNYKGTVHLQLPSGRILYYRNARIDTKNTIQYRWGHLWGGSITENIVQAVARDILAEAILRLEAANFPIVLHVHDEILTLMRDNYDDPGKDILPIMCEDLSWTKNLPISAEGEISRVYKK